MAEGKNGFRHESLQDAKKVKAILESLAKGLAKGSLTFSDEDGEIVLEPRGLLNLKLTARKDEARHKLNIRVSWHAEDEVIEKKNLKVG
ncbi:MAG: amphi-Trp domain-containing protein [Gammaproteobacteria bacterium]|nr:MAG: amphi-Trp domain-containing protein [Pseudomonadota bacterium]PIE38429.1 MAG: amphi-Trp domain-containing protein [Gammaproteobacteria bacterium]